MDYLHNESWTNMTLDASATSFSGLQLLMDLKPLFIPLYAMLVLVACSGNLLLLILIGLNKKLHSTTNFLIGNLALVDLVMCLFCVPLTAFYAFDERGWVFGQFMCYFVTLMQTATVFAAVLSLTAIAVDRYVVVAYPIRRRGGRSFCAWLVVSIWLCALAMSTPTALHTVYLDLSATGHEMVVCEEFWQGQELNRLIYSCFFLLLSYFVPLAAVSISYCAISCHLQHRATPRLMAATPSNQEKWGRKRRKTFRLLLVSVLSFRILLASLAGGQPHTWPGHRLRHSEQESRQCDPGVVPLVSHELGLLQPLHLCFSAQQVSVISMPEHISKKKTSSYSEQPHNLQPNTSLEYF